MGSVFWAWSLLWFVGGTVIAVFAHLAVSGVACGGGFGRRQVLVGAVFEGSACFEQQLFWGLRRCDGWGDLRFRRLPIWQRTRVRQRQVILDVIFIGRILSFF